MKEPGLTGFYSTQALLGPHSQLSLTSLLLQGKPPTSALPQHQDIHEIQVSVSPSAPTVPVSPPHRLVLGERRPPCWIQDHSCVYLALWSTTWSDI